MVLQGDVELETLSNTAFPWYDPDSKEREIQFREAYVIERNDWDKGIQGCVYQINGREFTDLSFAKGKTLAEYPDRYEIRQHMDGTKFLFYYSSIPTFDDADFSSPESKRACPECWFERSARHNQNRRNASVRNSLRVNLRVLYLPVGFLQRFYQ